MASALINYANAYLLITSEGIPSVIDGRIVSIEGDQYLVECYLKRQESTGTSTGADYTKASLIPGVSGDAYIYRGYALRYVKVIGTYDLEDGDIGFMWTEMRSTIKPNWFVDGLRCKHKQGLEQAKYCMIERCSGKYGGNKIDELISNEIGGIPIIVRSGDVIN